jgi:hypothetical protein
VEIKQFCQGKHKLTYGAWQERQEAEIEQAQQIQSPPPDDNKIQELEAQLKKDKEEGK